MLLCLVLAPPASVPCSVSNGTLELERFSSVGGGKLLPGFLFMQGESDGLEQSLQIRIGGGRGSAIPFVPDESCDDAIWDGASPDLRSPQLPYLKYDTWGCERQPATLPVIKLSTESMEALVTPQFGGKVWSMRDKAAGREFFFKSQAHQPANIGARGAWVAGGLEFNWAPGYLGHSAFTEERVWAAKLSTERGEMVRVYEFDRYRSTVFQVDILLDGEELWTHAKVSNPNNHSVLGYWWTCAAHEASPGTRIVAPAPEVTVETFVGSKLRQAPWPDFDNGMLNSTFGGLGGQRLVDSSFLGNIAYTGDYFLRIPPSSRKWIAHVSEGADYVAVHGHALNGTKFFTWGQSGPGRFMQDFLNGGVREGSHYTELQTGVKPTQQQVFQLEAKSTLSFTEYFKAQRREADSPLPADYSEAVAEVSRWWDSDGGVPASKVEAMESFFAAHEDRPVRREELISTGSPWGALHELLDGGVSLSPGATFFPPTTTSATDEAAIWRELAKDGQFSQATLSGVRAPLSYAIDGRWVEALEASERKTGSTWLHKLLLAVAYAEAGEVDRPVELLKAALKQPGGAASPVVARNLAVLSQTPDDAYPYFAHAWNLTRAPAPALESLEVTRRLAQNVGDECLQFLIGNVPGAASGTPNRTSKWYGRLKAMSTAVEEGIGPRGSDTIMLTRVILDTAEGFYDRAMKTLSTECFPTLGRGRDVLLSLWQACAMGLEAAAKGRVLTPVEAHRARRAAPIPRNLGCPYATLYCDNYW